MDWAFSPVFLPLGILKKCTLKVIHAFILILIARKSKGLILLTTINFGVSERPLEYFEHNIQTDDQMGLPKVKLETRQPEL